MEVQTAEQIFERRELTLGVSDGINVEVVEGLEENDLIKVWNKTEEPDKVDENEE